MGIGFSSETQSEIISLGEFSSWLPWSYVAVIIQRPLVLKDCACRAVMLANNGSSKCKLEKQVRGLHAFFCFTQKNPEGFTRDGITLCRLCPPCESAPKKLVLKQRLQLQPLPLATGPVGRRGIFFHFLSYFESHRKKGPTKTESVWKKPFFLPVKTFPMSTVVDI